MRLSTRDHIRTNYKFRSLGDDVILHGRLSARQHKGAYNYASTIPDHDWLCHHGIGIKDYIKSLSTIAGDAGRH
jgi:hypothetical protein